MAQQNLFLWLGIGAVAWWMMKRQPTGSVIPAVWESPTVTVPVETTPAPAPVSTTIDYWTNQITFETIYMPSDVAPGFELVPATEAEILATWPAP